MKIEKFCAHRGVSTLMPENALPAFGAALALGADEIEFDVRLSCDGQLIVSHDEAYEKYFEMGVDTLLTNRMDLAAAWKKKVQ